MSVILLFYAAALLIVIALAIASYRGLRRRSRLLAAGVASLVLASLVLLWPVPIHGGFTFLGEILYQELGHAMQQRSRDAERQKTADFSRRAANRDAGPLQFSVTKTLSGGWSQVQTDGGSNAWNDSDSGLLWSDWLPLASEEAMPSLADAQARCRQHPPAGYWALSTETDNYQLWQAGGEQLLPPAPASSIAQLLEPQTRLEMPTYQMKAAGNNHRQSSDRQRRFVVRCTARGPGSPAAGFSREDIPLAEWNRFQMRKMLPGNGT